MKQASLFTALLLLLFTFTATAQAEKPLSDTEKAEVVDSVSAILMRNYVFPETAEKMTALVKKELKADKYKSFTDAESFANQLTEDFRSISKDLHLRVRFAPRQIAEMRAMRDAPQDDNAEIFRERMRQGNFGFHEVKILDGNIGYLDLRGFTDTEFGSETAVAAMNFLANANAIIFDLRQNGGGSPSMIQLLTSYLYGSEPVHLNNFYWRPTDEHTQTWTLPYVPGKRNPDVDVYVLTSKRTFSAAEEFSYNLKNLERATLIGETTGGGAHPGGTQIATDRFTVWVPSGRAINPITGTNWEGTGVKPHIEVPQDQALEKAKLVALEKFIEDADSPEEKARHEWAILPLKAKLNPITIDENQLKSYVGSYGPRRLTFDNGHLYYQRDNGPKQELIPLADDLFMFEAAPFFRLKVLQKDGVITGLQGQYDDGRTDHSPIDKP